jgi:MYXO-CTERM domain-containing protein
MDQGRTLPQAVLRPLVAWDGRGSLISSADDKAVAGYITERGELATPTFPLATPNQVSGVAIAADGNGNGLIVTASDKEDDRFTGVFVTSDVAAESGGGGAGGQATVDPGTTAGTSSVPLAGSAATNGGEATSGGDNDAEAGEAGQPSAGGSAACAVSVSPTPDTGCGCSVAGGDTTRSPWLLFGLLSLVLRRRARKG